ncbi:hypothetical protein N665_2095s0001 [Sinapis alba]|nr:hypothetical protein N665_2095s0001 [Sinapis alba]
MKDLPDLSALIGGKLDLLGSNPMFILDGIDLGGSDLGNSGFGGILPDPLANACIDPVEEDKPLKMETARPKNYGKKRSRDERDILDIGRDSAPEGTGDARTEERPKKKKNKKKSAEKTLLRKRRKDPADGERGKKTLEGDDGLKLVLVTGEKKDSFDGEESTRHVSHQGSKGGDPPLPAEPRASIQDRVEFSYAGDCLLIHDHVQCAELVRQVRSWAETLPAVEDLMFRDANARAAQARFMSDGRMNLVVEKYDRSLKDTLFQLGQAEELLKEKDAEFAQKEMELREKLNVALADRDRAVARREVRKRKMEAMGAELASARAAATELEQKNTTLEREKATLEKEKADLEQERSVAALRFLKQTARLNESRSFEVMKERIMVQTAMIAKSSGTRKCLQKLIEQGAVIPHATVDLFAAQERRLEGEASAFEVREIPEEELSLSPLILPSRFLNEHALAGLDTHRSNIDLFDSATVANLQVPSDPLGSCVGDLAAEEGASTCLEEEVDEGNEGRVGAADSREDRNSSFSRSVFRRNTSDSRLVEPLPGYVSNQDIGTRLGSCASVPSVWETLTLDGLRVFIIAAEPVKAAYVPPKRIKPRCSSFYRVKVTLAH